MRKRQKKAASGSTGTGIGMTSSLIVSLVQTTPAIRFNIKKKIPNLKHFFHDFSDLFRQAPFSLLFCSFTGGNVYSALVSRLGTSMHLGLFSPTLKKGNVLYQNVYASLLLTMILSVILGLLAKLMANAFGTSSISVYGFILISVIGGLISGIALLGIAVLVSIIGYRRSWNLDNVSSPIITSAGELSTLFVFVAVLCLVKGLKSDDSAIRRILIESIPMLFLCAILCTLAGITLDIQLKGLIAIPAILVIIPPFLGESNALGGILSARLSSMLHIGTINPQRVPDKLVASNFAVIYLFSICVFLLVGLCTTFLNFASYYIAILSFRFGLDPDNDTIPLITSLTDVVGVLCLLFAMFLIL
jgi:mgtE-like transporter